MSAIVGPKLRPIEDQWQYSTIVVTVGTPHDGLDLALIGRTCRLKFLHDVGEHLLADDRIKRVSDCLIGIRERCRRESVKHSVLASDLADISQECLNDPTLGVGTNLADNLD